MFAAVRVQKISKMSQMKGLSMHAMRLDKNTQKYLRDDAHKGRCLAWSSAEKADNRNVSEAFKQFKKREKANEYQGASLGLHMLCVVSPDWIKEAGGIHERRNPRNAMLMKAAKDWAESIGGKGSVIASRLDLDEKGGGVVDLYFCPTKMVKGKKFILTSSVLRDLRHELDESREYSALQTSWAAYAKQALDDRFERGVRVEQTGRKYYSPELFREYAEKAVAVEKAGISEQLKRSKNMRKRSLDRFVRVSERENELDAKIAAFEARSLAEKADLERREAEFSALKQKANDDLDAERLKAQLDLTQEISVHETRLTAKEDDLNNRDRSLNQRERALEERELKVSANDRKIENAYQRLNSEQSALSDRQARLRKNRINFINRNRERLRRIHSNTRIADRKMADASSLSYKAHKQIEAAEIRENQAFEKIAKFNSVQNIFTLAQSHADSNPNHSMEMVIGSIYKKMHNLNLFKQPENARSADQFFKTMKAVAGEIDLINGVTKSDTERMMQNLRNKVRSGGVER